MGLFRRASLSLVFIDRIAPQREYSAGVTFSMSFGGRDSGTTGYRRTEGDAGAWSSQAYASVQRNLPEQEGWGYRVRVSQSDADMAENSVSGEAGLARNAPYGSYGLEAATFEDFDAYRATLSGGVGTLAGHTFASRRLSSSFAIVEAGAGDIDLLVNNRLAGRTNAEGFAVLPYLQPYQNTIVSIDATNVPMDVEVHSGEFRAAPYYRSGVLIPLDARRTRSAVVPLVLADGKPVPAGAIARLASGGAEFPVGKKGVTFLSQLQPGANAVDVRWDGRRCRAAVTLPADAGIQPRLGPVTCQETP
jgi:outer membrane usher protein